jgi:hypothetical protein
LLKTPIVLEPTTRGKTSFDNEQRAMSLFMIFILQLKDRPSESISFAILRARDDATSAACAAGITTSSIASLCPA